uniref:Uncharacterized protein n=1 Tax=viral metagenome TaxID=1070528 RepID=A0A6M3LN04_9ZZZZ
MIAVEEVKVEITTFGSEKEEHIIFFVCEQNERFDDKIKCGFYDFCQYCKKRFICATERK